MAQLGKYQLVAEIARGGMGIVYLAIARGPARFSKLLVVKQLKPDLVEDPSFLEMFLEEARLAARLSHPNIVQTYEVGNDDDRHYMVMDYLEGVTLARVLRRKNPNFTLALHLRVISEALQGLHYAHTLTDFDGTLLGIVHRDATPQNVFVTYDGQVKLVDFGIAKALDSTVETSTGVLKGKPSYMAPEQIAGDVDPRADVFTAGVMIWEAVVGRRMWHKKGDVEILTNIIKGDVPSISEAAPQADPELIRIVNKALAKSRDDRYESAAALQADIEAFLVASGVSVSLRDVAKVVSEIFSAERIAVKATIETHLAGLKLGKDGRLPSLRPPPTADLPEGTTPISERNLQPSLVTSPTSPASLTPGMGRTPPGTEMPSATPVTEVDGAVAAAAAGRNNKLIGGAIAVVGLLVIGGVVVATRKDTGSGSDNSHRTNTTTTPPASVSLPVLDVKPPTPEPTSVGTHEVSVKAYPANAVVTIDGAEVGNPVRKRCVHGNSFSVHASSPGHVSQDRTLRCEQDESIEIALTSAPAAVYTPPPPWAPPAKPAVATKPTAAPPATTTTTNAGAETSPPTAKPSGSGHPGEVNPGGGTKPNRPIDTSSPYNK